MKITIPNTKSKTVNVKTVEVILPINYGDEEMPYDFPFREHNEWKAKIDIDEGKILDWPELQTEVNICVRDEGVYTLLDENDEVIASIEGYVPHGIVPGEYGDYVSLDIGVNGIINNWPGRPNLEEFFDSDKNV